MSPLVACLIALASIVVNGFFVAAEFALLAARPSRIEQLAAAGDRGAVAAQRALRELSLMLAGAQLGITVATLVLGAVAEPALAVLLAGVFEDVGLPEGLVHPTAFAIALAVVVFLHMVVGEMAPKSWAIVDPERSALLVARPFRAFTQAVRPFLVALNTMANGLLRLVGVQPQDGRTMQVGPAELAVLLEESVGEGKIEEDEADLIGRALRLSGLTAATAMVPREHVDAVPADADVAAIEAAAARHRRSRLVVRQRDLDDLLGVVHLRDVLSLDRRERLGRSASEFVYSIIDVDASTPLEDVLLAMQRQRRHMAAVRGDDGALVGIVTMHDVLRHLIERPSVDSV